VHHAAIPADSHSPWLAVVVALKLAEVVGERSLCHNARVGESIHGVDVEEIHARRLAADVPTLKTVTLAADVPTLKLLM
jgi:hypothetical protein